MIGSKAGRPGARWAALSAYAAGVAGTLANLFLIAFFALQVSRSVKAASFDAGGVLAASGVIGTPFWFLLLGRHLARS